MTRRSIAIVSVACIALLIATVACSDDNDASGEVDSEAQRYLQEVDDLNVEFATRNSTINDEYPDAYAGDLAQLKNAYPEYVELFNEISARMEELVPADDLTELHRQLVDSNAVIAAENEGRLVLVEQAENQADVDAVFAADHEYDAAALQGIQFCVEAGQRAKELDVEWHSDCEG